ncbi:MAG: hypothetical protein WAK01_06925 [Methylocystis sp.]
MTIQRPYAETALFSEPLWDTETTAGFLGKSPKSLEADRFNGRGLPYVKMGRAVRYDPAAVRVYLARKTICTSDSGEAA